MSHQCLHPDCQLDVPEHQLACRPHWYELETPLRNRIVRYYANGNRVAHAKAVRDAIAAWTGPLPPGRGLRCHKCRQPTDFRDTTTGKGLCIVCVRAALDDNDVTYTCPRCHQPTGALASIDDGPHLCLDCQYHELLHQEATSI